MSCEIQKQEIIDNFLLQNSCYDNHFRKSLLRSVDVFTSHIPLYLAGETGVGKTFLAEKIHQLRNDLQEIQGGKRQSPYVALNCATHTELLESELFGHVKGAFTGATSDRKGKLALADGGTLFLDEIGVMPIVTQVKLLKVIEEKEFYPLGSDKKVKSDFKLISASCDDIHELLIQNLLRADFYQRIAGYTFKIPSLRERFKDIEFLFKSFLQEFKGNRKMPLLSDGAYQKIIEHHWSGNLRELKNTAEIVSFSVDDLITLEDLDFMNSNLGTFSQEKEKNSRALNLVNPVQNFYDQACIRGLKSIVFGLENEILNRVLKENNNCARKTMKALKIHPSTFYTIKNRVLKP